MSTQKKLIALCFTTVFTLGLAACGGGGGGALAPEMAMPDMDGDGSLKGKYILSGTTITGVDVSDVTLTAASGESVDLPGLVTVECASDGGCSGTVADGVLTTTGHLKILSVDPALDTETATVLAGLAVDMLPEPDVDMLPDEPDPAIAQREAISSAIEAANTAVGVVTDAATDEEVAAADMAIAAAKMAIADAANVPAEEAVENSGMVSVLETALANAKTSRTAAIAAEAVRLAAEAAIAQREAISSAIATANAAVGVVTDAATAAEVAAARYGDRGRQDGDRGRGQCSG